MSYTFSSPSLPPGFSIVGSKLLASANAPAFAGTITIALTDGLTTVNKVIAIDRRPTTVSALVTQILDLVSITGQIDSFVDFEIVVQTMVSEVGFNDSFSFIPMSSLLSVTGADDGFTLGASVLADNITADGVAFRYRLQDINQSTVTDFNLAVFIELRRLYEDTPQTSEAAIGCVIDSAAGFRTNLLEAARVKFSYPGISAAYCDVTTFPQEGDSFRTIIYTFRTNNGADPGN